MARRVLVAIMLTGSLLACNSPEATRTRGGGPGADVGNRGSVELHGSSEIYYGTPMRITAAARGTDTSRRGAQSK